MTNKYFQYDPTKLTVTEYSNAGIKIIGFKSFIESGRFFGYFKYIAIANNFCHVETFMINSQYEGETFEG